MMPKELKDQQEVLKDLGVNSSYCLDGGEHCISWFTTDNARATISIWEDELDCAYPALAKNGEILNTDASSLRSINVIEDIIKIIYEEDGLSD